MTSETDPKPTSNTETNGGANNSGNIDADGDFVRRDRIDGDVVQGDKTTVGNISNNTAVAVGTGATAIVTITEETAYNVQGLRNPYLGLRAFSYEDRAIYAGREQLAQETVAKLTDPQSPQAILFITGASGSGKSSFAQAGLISMLESHYAAYGKNVHHAVFRPSSQPMVMLADALQKLHRDLTPETLATNTPKEQINLLIIDQFEELFIQSEATQRDSFCDFLTNLPAFAANRTHILSTLRVDYLDELFAIQPLWAIAKGGVELRTMKADDLRNAIQKPLQVNHPQKRFAPELLDRLVQDASVDAALLPLLQVTLAELWKSGRLVLSNYHSLTDAIRQRADTVYDFSDHEKNDPQSKRSSDEQKGLMNILLALINVSADGDDRRDARQRRTRYELEQGSAQRSKLIEEMVNVRLLSAAREIRNGQDVEVIDVIHESLLVNWDRLKQSIAEQRQQLQRRARFKLWLSEWLRNGRQDGALLSDLQLAEAQALADQHDIELQNPEAHDFYTCSWQYLEANQKRELENQRRLAAEQSRRARIFRNAVIVAGLLMLIAIGLAEWGRRSSIRASNNAATATIALATSDASVIEVGKERDRANREAENAAMRADEARIAQADAEQQAKIAFSRQLAAQSTSELGKSRYESAILLAIESGRITETFESFSAIRLAIANPMHSRLVFYGQLYNVSELSWSRDASKILTESYDGSASIWSATNGKELVRLKQVGQANWSQDESKILTLGHDNTAHIWDTTTGKELVKLKGYTNSAFRATWSGDNSKVITSCSSNTACIWDSTTGKELVRLDGHSNTVFQAIWSKDDSKILTSSNDGTARIWNAISGKQLVKFTGVSEATWNGDEKRILTLTSSDDNTARIWDATTGKELITIKGIAQVIWIQDRSRLFTYSQGGVHILNATTGKELGNFEGLTQATWSKDESKILTLSDDNTARIWDAVTGRELTKLEGHTKSVWSATWSKDESRILTFSADNTARIWDAVTGKELTKLEGHTKSIQSATWSKDESRILTLGNDNTVRIWDAVTGKEVVSLKGDTAHSTWEAKWVQDASKVVTYYPGTVHIWDAATGEELGKFEGISRAIWSKDESRILAIADNTARIWDAAAGSELTKLEGHTNAVSQAIWSKDENRILTLSYDNTARIWDAATSEELVRLKGYAGNIWQATWGKDGKKVLTSSYDTTARIWDATTGEELVKFEGVTQATWSKDESKILTRSDSNYGIWDVSTGKELIKFKSDSWRLLLDHAPWSQDESKILTISADNTASIWDVTTGKELVRFNGHTNEITQEIWSKDEAKVFTLSKDDGSARLWDAATGRELASFYVPPKSAYEATWSRNEDKILTLGPFSTASIWDVATKTKLANFVEVSQAIWSKDESRILISAYDETAGIWDVRIFDVVEDNELVKLEGHTGPIYQATWSQDESRILTSSNDNTARIWDAATGKELVRLEGHIGPVAQVTWNQDESRILTASNDGTVRVWYVKMSDLLVAGCKWVPRNFTWSEWSQYMADSAGSYRPTCPNAPIPPDAIEGIQDEARQQILAGQNLNGMQRLEELNGWLKENGQFDSFGVDVQTFVADVSAIATIEVEPSPTVTPMPSPSVTATSIQPLSPIATPAIQPVSPLDNTVISPLATPTPSKP